MMSDKLKRIIVYLIVLSFLIPVIGTIVFEIFNINL